MTTTDPVTDKRLNALTQRWGWQRPTEAVVKNARLALTAQGKDLLPAAIALGHATLDDIDAWREKIPDDIRRAGDSSKDVIDNWLAEHVEGVRTHRQRIDALRGGYQYFDSLKLVSPQPAMGEQADIHDYCKRRQCLLCRMEKQRNLVIFAEFETLRAFQRSSNKRPPTQREIDDIAFYMNMEEISGDGLPAEVTEADPHGCEHCKRGYRGLVPVNEILPANRQVKSLLSASVIDHKEIAKHRTITMFESAMRLVRAGSIEVSRIPR